MAKRGRQILRPRRIITDLAYELMPEDASPFLKNANTSYNKNGQSEGEDHNLGVLTPIQSNINNAVFGDALPAGTNITIGAYYDRKMNQMYWWVWNSNDDHTIWVYDAYNNAATLVLQEPLLNFNPHYPITSHDVVIADVSTDSVNVDNLNRLLYWSDGYNPPAKINVDKAITGGYAGLTFLRSPDEYFLQVKYPPLDVDLTSTLENPDPNYPLNWIQNKMFQFRYRYIYDDGEKTTWSAISTLYYTTNTDKNFVELSMDVGSSLVTHVELAFRETNIGDWKQYDSIKRSLIIANTDYPYDNVTNIFKYKFYNNQAYNILDQNDTNRLFNLVPLKSGAQEFVENNVMLHGNILEGYDNLDLDTINTPEITVTYDDYAQLTLTLTGQIPFAFSGARPGDSFSIGVHVIDVSTGIDTAVDTYTIIKGTTPNPINLNTAISQLYGSTYLDVGDIIYLSFDSLSLSGGSARVDAVRELIGTYTNITNPLSCGTGDFDVVETATSQTVVVGDHVTFDTLGGGGDDCNTWDFTLYQDVCPNYSEGASQLKQNGSYQFGFVCYDDALRSTFVQTSPQWLVDIKSIQESDGFKTIGISIDWNSMVLPDWVKYVKIVRTKNKNIDRSLGMGYIQFGITDVLFLEADGTSHASPVGFPIVNVQFTLKNMADFNTANFNNTTTTYQFVQGDRIQIIANGDGTIYDSATYGILDFPLSTPDTQLPITNGTQLQFPYNSDLSTLTDGAWVEIYTPSKQAQTDKYFEITPDFIATTGDVGNNQLVDATTDVTTWDTYSVFWDNTWWDKSGWATPVPPSEHHSVYLANIVPSNGEDIGRFNFVNATARQIWKPAFIRRSEPYIPNTYNNGLSTYIEGNDSGNKFNRARNGIVQMINDGYKLYVIQQDGNFITLLAKQLVSLADGSQQLVAVNDFFSDPIVGNGENYGCQNSESIIEWGDYIFWVDAKRKAVVKCDWQQCTDIATSALCKSYFVSKLSYIQRYNNDAGADTDFYTILGGFDPKYKQYILTFFNIKTDQNTESIELTSTGSEINLMLNGLSGAVMNFQNAVADDFDWFDIYDTTFMDNIDSLNFHFLLDWGEAPNHYGIRYAGDRPNSAPPTARGGYNTTETCNDGSGGANTYPVSFTMYEVGWCERIGMGMIFNCNIQDTIQTGRSSGDMIAAYLDNANYVATQIPFYGFVLTQEYEDADWCGTPSIVGDETDIVTYSDQLSNGLIGTYPNTDYVYSMDWRGVHVGQPLTNTYANTLKTADNITSVRLYLAEPYLMQSYEYAGGRTAQQYKESIDTAIDTQLPYYITGIKAASGKKISNNGYFSQNTGTGFAGTFLQLYFVARMRIKTILIEADDPSFDFAALGRGDVINARTTLNKWGKMLAMISPIWESGNTVYTVDLGEDRYGMASVNGSNHGYLVYVNASAEGDTRQTITVNSIDQPILSITSMSADDLLGVPSDPTTEATVPPFSVSLIEF